MREVQAMTCEPSRLFTCPRAFESASVSEVFGQRTGRWHLHSVFLLPSVGTRPENRFEE